VNIPVKAAIAQREAIDFLVEVFRERSFARALLYLNGFYEFHEAVDELQRWAEQRGLVAAIGQDAVQAMLAGMFAPTADELAMLEARDKEPVPRAAESPSIDPQDEEPPPRRGVAASTLDAVTWLIQQGDAARLHDFLEKHTAVEREGIRNHFSKEGRAR
jgi:hypothetical protein